MTTFSEGTRLSAEEARVVGALAEKQLATPDYYPLTLNALVNACNQISNRDPVVSYDERTVAAAIESLRAQGLAREVRTADGRVPKYRHVLDEALGLSKAELALLCVLLLRGTQTPGELRGRTERLYPFSGTQFVESALEGLMSREGRAPLVVKLPRAAGQKESRYAQLLTGEVKFEEQEATAGAGAATTARASRVDGERVARLEEELGALRAELEGLREQFAEFKRQFE
ncbi:MAG: YceH family protein [Acidobacteria bacterium]|nr:YceH family protein [Acidobacteriota bacterium]